MDDAMARRPHRSLDLLVGSFGRALVQQTEQCQEETNRRQSSPRWRTHRDEFENDQVLLVTEAVDGDPFPR